MSHYATTRLNEYCREYPKNADEARNFVELLACVRREMDDYSNRTSGGHHFELTVACPAGPDNINKLDVGGMSQYVDFWNLMAYDYAGSWDQNSGHQANLYPSRSLPASTPYSTTAAIELYQQKGVPSDKIVLGMPLYGRTFENTDGLGKPYNGVGPGTWEAGVYDYKKLPLEGAEERTDAEAVASYCYNAGSRVLVTYDTKAMAKTKAEYIKQRGLGGGMWWESSADKAGDESLIKTVVDEFGGPNGLLRQDNCISYPETKYDNLRAGFP